MAAVYRVYPLMRVMLTITLHVLEYVGVLFLVSHTN